MSDSEDLSIGDFDPTTYQHVLPKGAHDYDIMIATWQNYQVTRSNKIDHDRPIP